MSSENAAWHRRMPWKLMGFGAAFVGALFAWHFTRDAPTAVADGRLLSAHTLLEAGGAADFEEPVVAEAPARTPRTTRREQEDPGLDVTVVVEGEDAVVEEVAYVDTVPEKEPHRVVIVVQQSAPVPPVRKPFPVRGSFRSGRVPSSGGFTPRNPRVPGGPLTPRTQRSQPAPRRHASAPRRRASSSTRIGGNGATNRRRPSIRRR